MGEIFSRELSDKALDFTGERMTSGHSGQVEFEHLHRYFFAREFCRDKDVLDVAAGEGYGSAYLAQNAQSVIGVELSAEAVEHASASYQRPNLTFRHGDARRMTFPDASFDIVTSFETIEHFLGQDEFLDEVRRVLRPEGVFIISSPDRDVYSPVGGPVNPFHVKELSRQEFVELLRTRFRHCDFYAQRPMTGSAILAETTLNTAERSRTFERRGDQHFESSRGLPRAPYVLAVASNVPIPAGFDSVFIETSDVDWPQRQMASHEAQVAELGRQMHVLQQQRDMALQQRDATLGEAEIVKAYVRKMETSTSWRWTAPLRQMVHALRK